MHVDLYRAAEWYAARGWEPVAIARGSKTAVHKWKGKTLTPSQRKYFFLLQGCELALKTGTVSGFVVIDIDDAAGLAKASEAFARTGWIVETPSGGQHWYYIIDNEFVGNRIGLFGCGIDVRGENGLVKAPPSSGYRLIGRGELVRFDASWLPPKLARQYAPVQDGCNRLQRARLYVSTIHAHEGSRGDTQAYKAACALIRKFGLSEQEALDELRIWNAYNAHPPFEDSRLRYKISEALKGQ